MTKIPQINTCQIAGRITNEIELKHTPKGTAVTKFTVATDSSYKDADGQWQKETTFIDCVAWSGLAEQVDKQCKKGIGVIVNGKLSIRSYVDANNQNRKVFEVVADRVMPLEWKEERDTPPEVNDNAPF